MRRLTLEQHRTHDAKIVAILSDPEITHPEERLFAIMLRRAVDFGTPTLGKDGTFNREACAALYGTKPYARDAYRGLIRNDIRRYDLTAGEDYTHRVMCPVPLPRAQRPCGKSASWTWWDTDITTGERRSVGYCTKHREEGRKAHAWDAAQVKQAGDSIPRPYANTGGRVRKHCPEILWEDMWRAVDPKWEPYPERSEPVFVRPTLKLIVGGLE